jgi:hypothetical protein
VVVVVMRPAAVIQQRQPVEIFADQFSHGQKPGGVGVSLGRTPGTGVAV